MEEQSFFSENKWAIWLIIISLVVIAGVAYFIFKPSKTQRKPNISISIDSPQQTASGGQVTYRVQFANNDTEAVNNVSLDMLYPSGFTFASSNPPAAKLDGTHFTLPNLDPGVSSQIIITGSLNGNSGEIKTISGVLHYRFANFNGDFFAKAESHSQITNSNIVLQFDGPTTTNNDQTIVYNLSYNNTADHDLSNVVLKLTLPSNFAITSLDPQPDSSTQTVYTLGMVSRGQSGNIRITGRFTGAQVGSQQAFAAEADGHDDNGQPVIFSNASYLATISTVPLAADISVQDQNAEAGGGKNIVYPGDALIYTLHYKNNNSTAMHAVNLTVKLDGEAFDLASVRAQNASISGNAITWDASQVSDFEALNPNQEGNLNFTVSVKNPATRSNNSNLSIAAHTEIKSLEITQAFVGQNLSLKVQTVPVVEAAIAFSGGVNPPRTTATTTYVMTLSLRNSTDDISGAVLTMNLPNSLGFDAGSITPAERQNVTYDNGTRKLTWNIGTLPAHTGDFKTLRKLQFNITINPQPANVGQPMTLANHIELNGTDSFTSVAVVKDLQDITTISDPSGQGVVAQ